MSFTLFWSSQGSIWPQVLIFPFPGQIMREKFFCVVVNYHRYHQMLQYPKAVVDLQPANKQWTHASDMKIYPSFTDRKLVIAMAWVKCVQWALPTTMAWSKMSAMDTSDCLDRELVNGTFILLQLQRGEISGTLSCRDTQMNGVTSYPRR
jgi:hypothetical protein